MRYCDNIDYLTSSIIYVGTDEYYWARTPVALAAELSLDEGRLKTVFDGFPGLFRKSARVGSNGQHFYSLQARYSQRKGGDTRDPDQISEIRPIDTEKVKLLLDFVLTMTEHEKNDSRTYNYKHFNADHCNIFSNHHDPSRNRDV